MSGGHKREQDGRRREQVLYEREQELTTLYRQVLEAVREDAEEAIGEAVRSAAPTAADWEGIVRRVVREEVAGVAPAGAERAGSAPARKPASKPWPTWAAVGVGAVGAAMLVGAGWWMGRLSGPWPGRATDAGGVPAVTTDTTAPSVDAMPDGAADTAEGVGTDTLMDITTDTMGANGNLLQVVPPDTTPDSARDILGLEILPEDVP